MKKRVIAGALGMALAGAMAMSVFADNTMNVEYTMVTTYTLSIPAKVILNAQSTVESAKIGVSAVNTEPDKKVQVKISSGITDGQVELQRTGDTATKVVSDVSLSADGNDPVKITAGSVVAEFQDLSEDPIEEGTGVLYFSAIRDSADDVVKAGSYTGEIVFEGSVTDR